ncbi:MAG: hypothetical protein PF442_12335 [Desulfobulbaceae bacterium]|nr:hypothetical protein [Desulfobulbaceae bacterium]
MNAHIWLDDEEEANLRLVPLDYDVEFAANGAAILWSTWDATTTAPL